MAKLSAQDQDRIDAIIEDIKLRTGFTYPGGNVLDLAKMEGIEVYQTDLSEFEPGLSGALRYDDEERKTNPRIYLNSGMLPDRKLFTLAHELGHHFLHRGQKLRLDDLDYSEETKDVLEESEANYFAASLLVPKYELLKLVPVMEDAKAIAEYFKVSPAVIENRLRWIQSN